MKDKISLGVSTICSAGI